MNRSIGIVTIEYNESGEVTKTSFEPKMKLWNTDSVKSQLRKLPCPSKIETLKHNAELVFAAWFNQYSHIEMVDRTEGYVDSEFKDCERHYNNVISKCVIEYTFKTIECKVTENSEVGCV